MEIRVDTRELKALAGTGPGSLLRTARDYKNVQRSFLSSLAFEARDWHTDEIPKHIDRPNPFTQRAMGWQAATTQKAYSEVFVKPLQAEYLYRLVEPGVRKPQRKYIFIPARELRRNPYGNMPRALRRRVLGAGNLVTQEVGRVKLIRARTGPQRGLVGIFARQTLYRKKRWDFPRLSEVFYTGHYKQIFARQYARYEAKQRGVRLR